MVKTNLRKTIWSTLCFVFFMTLAAGSGCDGCSGSGVYSNDTIAADSLEPETPVLEETPEENFAYDVDEDEREKEETYQSETEDEPVEENQEEEHDSLIHDSI